MKTLLLSDFSKTLTVPTSKTTWSLFKESGSFPKEYAAKRDELYETYRPFELAGDNAKVSEWFGKHLDLLGQYDAVSKIPETVRVSLEKEFLSPREGLEEFLQFATSADMTLRIVSSGISELIQNFLSVHGAKLPIGFPKKTSSGIFANDLLRHDGVRSVRTPIDKFLGTAPLFDSFDRIVVLGDAAEDFAILGVTYVKGGKFRWFSFSDDEIVPGVVPLGKDGSLARVTKRIIQ